VFFSSLSLPLPTLPGLFLLAALLLGWYGLSRPSWQWLKSVTQMNFLLFMPYYLFLPFFPGVISGEPGAGFRAFLITSSVVIHGMAGVWILTSIAGLLTPVELRQALLSLPLPLALTTIVLQILHQAAELIRETQRMASAIALRGAARGWASSLRLLVSIPQLWLPRVLQRAERTAAAMEIRGFNPEALACFERATLHSIDYLILGLSTGIWVGILILRGTGWI
jgi:energy-coupling factor transporter transmembrane protein EcfT